MFNWLSLLDMGAPERDPEAEKDPTKGPYKTGFFRALLNPRTTEMARQLNTEYQNAPLQAEQQSRIKLEQLQNMMAKAFPSMPVEQRMQLAARGVAGLNQQGVNSETEATKYAEMKGPEAQGSANANVSQMADTESGLLRHGGAAITSALGKLASGKYNQRAAEGKLARQNQEEATLANRTGNDLVSSEIETEYGIPTTLNQSKYNRGESEFLLKEQSNDQKIRSMSIAGKRRMMPKQIESDEYVLDETRRGQKRAERFRPLLDRAADQMVQDEAQGVLDYAPKSAISPFMRGGEMNPRYQKLLELRPEISQDVKSRARDEQLRALGIDPANMGQGTAPNNYTAGVPQVRRLPDGSSIVVPGSAEAAPAPSRVVTPPIKDFNELRRQAFELYKRRKAAGLTTPEEEDAMYNDEVVDGLNTR